MNSRISWAIVILTAAVLAGCTLMFCETPGGANSAELQPPIASVARFLSLPGFGGTFRFANASEARSYCLPLGAAALLLLIAISGLSPSSAHNATAPSTSPSGWIGAWFGWRGRFGPAGLLAILACVFAIASAFINRSLSLSTGWCFEFACGLTWAAALALLLDARTVRRLFAAAGVIAVTATILTLWHRSVLGIQYVRWPIGPLTATGSMAAMWAAGAMGVVWAALIGVRASGRPPLWIAAVAGVPLVLGIILTALAERRGSFLGLAAALEVTAALVILSHWRDKITKLGIAGVFAISAVVAGLWIAGQLRSERREISGPLVLRQAYWGAAWDAIKRQPLLGIGPDRTVCTITTALARQHAEMPHVIHGSFVPILHNEWLQAILELGIPGGLAYLGIPIALLIGAALAFGRDESSECRPWLAAGAAAIAAIVVIEATSINLRGPVMSPWYWTFIGITAAMIRGDRARESRLLASAPSGRAMQPFARTMTAALGLAILFLAFDDFQRTRAHVHALDFKNAEPELAIRDLEFAARRFGAENQIKARIDRGLIESDLVRSLARQHVRSSSAPASKSLAEAAAGEWPRRAVATWREVCDLCHGYPGAGGFLGESLLGAGFYDDARAVLNWYLRDVDPYDLPANLLYATALAKSPIEKIELIRRGIRAGGVDQMSQKFFQAAMEDEAARAWWAERVLIARDDVQSRNRPDWRDPLAPETLRLETWRFIQAKELAAALAVQKLAAQSYLKLEDSNDPFRRAETAEIDAFLVAADLCFHADPGAYRDAFDLITQAEKFAALSVEHETVRNPDPKSEFVGGHVRPMETPDRLIPVWRLSAKLHIATGRTDLKDLEPRLLLALPESERNSSMKFELDHRLGLRLSYELAQTFEGVAPARRPPDYPKWAQLAERVRQSTQPSSRPAEDAAGAPGVEGPANESRSDESLP